jgi:hypothetical protein
MRRPGIFLRHSFTVASLLSLNGTLGMSLFSRLSPNWDLLFSILLAPQDIEQWQNLTPYWDQVK